MPDFSTNLEQSQQKRGSAQRTSYNNLFFNNLEKAADFYHNRQIVRLKAKK